MHCYECQAEINPDSQTCPYCGARLHQVEVLSPEERENFQGLTIDASDEKEGSQDHYDQEYEYYNPLKGVYVRRFSFGNGKGGFLNQLAIGLIVLGLLFLAFPLLFIFAGVLLFGWLMSVLLRRR
ncbi:MAG TPA: zinc ribbon domain-containing protein [Bacillota bacterium]